MRPARSVHVLPDGSPKPKDPRGAPLEGRRDSLYRSDTRIEADDSDHEFSRNAARIDGR